MTTEYKQALELLELDAAGWQDHHKETIRRALMKADSIHSGELDKEDGKYSWEEVAHWNACLEHLRKIGSGE